MRRCPSGIKARKLLFIKSKKQTGFYLLFFKFQFSQTRLFPSTIIYILKNAKIFIEDGLA